MTEILEVVSDQFIQDFLYDFSERSELITVNLTEGQVLLLRITMLSLDESSVERDEFCEDDKVNECLLEFSDAIELADLSHRMEGKKKNTVHPKEVDN